MNPFQLIGMLQHAQNLEFEKAARVRDQLAQLRNRAFFPK